ncbi:sperm acrosomal FSA isoform X4, putative [Babesia ovata]|uniref:Sperm acrosomal FSA isoform X4, putative n=1 Tax=Babesia ovata TaxID=189622 RepID=A0A2H6K8E1_9APIC|nr:sperm acrosomal FSA isoform X4, putative [Babesia ovata]GBE59265.1 sperm acrosomal FSA isoform X4, putative [Babesia ovata]
MKHGSESKIGEELDRFLLPTGPSAKVTGAIQSFHDGRISWKESCEQLRTVKSSGEDGAGSGRRMFCALTLKHHAYHGLRRLCAAGKLPTREMRDKALDDLVRLCCIYESHDKLILRQLLYAVSGLAMTFFDISANERDFLLNTALLKLEGRPLIQFELLSAFAEELFNETICVSSFTRADVVRSSVMIAPRIFGRLFAFMGDKANMEHVPSLSALAHWLGLHVRLVRTFGGTHEYVPNEAHGGIHTLDMDSMGAKIPRDDAVLIRNGLNAFGAMGGVFSLFERLRHSIVVKNVELSEFACEALMHFYSLTQFDFMSILTATSQRYNDVSSHTSRSWTASAKPSITQLPCIVTDSCHWAMDFVSQLQEILCPVMSQCRDNPSDPRFPVVTQILRNVMEFLVVIAAEHIPFILMFSEGEMHKACAVCFFVNEAVRYPDIRCRELCLDFYVSMIGILFATKDAMVEPHLSTCILRIVQAMRHNYTDFVRQLLKSATLDLDKHDEAAFDNYRRLVAVFIDEAIHIIGVNVLVMVIQCKVKALEEGFDWVEAEMCAFLIRAVAHRLTTGLADAIIMKYLSIVCDHKRFRELYEEKGDAVASYVHRSVADCIILMSGLIVQDEELLKAAQELCIRQFGSGKGTYPNFSARAMHALALSADYSTCDVFDLMRHISQKIAQADSPLPSRLELLGGIANLLSTFNDSAKVRLRRDFVVAMSMRLNGLIDAGRTENMSDEIALYMSTLFLVDFKPWFTTDVGGNVSKECMELMRRNHESTTLRRIKRMNTFWPQVDLCLESLRVDQRYPSNDIENVTRLLIWILKEANFGSHTHLLALNAAFHSARLCKHEKLLNKCMDTTDKYVSRILSVVLGSDDFGDSSAASVSDFAASEKDAVRREANVANSAVLQLLNPNPADARGDHGYAPSGGGAPSHSSRIDEFTRNQHRYSSYTDGFRSADHRPEERDVRNRFNGSYAEGSHATANHTNGSRHADHPTGTASESSAGSNFRQSASEILRIHNAERFRSEGDLNSLDLFTNAVRAGVNNHMSALKLLTWPKFGRYVAVVALLLPTENPALNRSIVELFVAVVHWIRRTRAELPDKERQKRRLIRNAARAILLGKHFAQCNMTMADVVASSILQSLMSRPCQVEGCIPPATRVIHTLIGSKSFYPMVAASVKSCMRASHTTRRRLSSCHITMWSTPRE